VKYRDILSGTFISRPNRFIARVLIDEREETVHVKNTGRCRELLQKGCTVYLERAVNPKRKTPFDLVAVEKNLEGGGTVLINMDSQVVNDAAEEWLSRGCLFSANASIRREYTYKKSRFDFYIEDGERKAFLEVKGVTLERDGQALFPDAPTERGAKHLSHLCDAVSEGYEAYVLFVIQMKGIKEFLPNEETDKRFADALRVCKETGVRILASDCIVTPSSIEIDAPVPVKL